MGKAVSRVRPVTAEKPDPHPRKQRVIWELVSEMTSNLVDNELMY